MKKQREQEIHPAEIRELFINIDPLETWAKASAIINDINPNFDLGGIREVFDDAMCLFNGSFPGYSRIQTPYHDLRHTLDVFMCSVRLLHGIHLSGTKLSNEEISISVISALLHDIGYAQKNIETNGSGAQFTQTHVARGVDFMKQQQNNWHLPPAWVASIEAIMSCTKIPHDLSLITFPSLRIRLLGQIIGTGDLVGQMADRCYLEKLLFLYLEFKEADIGNFRSIQDMLKQTRKFYELTLDELNNEFDAVYQYLSHHFEKNFGIKQNYYLNAIECNMEYLEQIVKLHESEWLSMLKRHGIVRSFQNLSNHANA